MDVKSREEIIKFAQKLNSTNLSPLRSGNISLKVQNNNKEVNHRGENLKISSK